MEELALHVLDLAQNSVEAGARSVAIRVHEDTAQDRLLIEVADDGPGMAEATRKRAADPFFTTRSTRSVGLGLSLLEQAARAAGGEISIESRPGAGTRVTAVFKPSHPDRQPLGDMAATLLVLAAGHPEVEFSYHHRRDPVVAQFCTEEVRRQLGGKALNSPAGIAALRQKLSEMFRQLSGVPEAEVRHGIGDD